MKSYKGFDIYERNGLYTVGGSENVEYEDCTLENLNTIVDEFDMVSWCRENGIRLVFIDFRKDNFVSYEEYLSHLSHFDTDPEGTFLDEEFIVPFAVFTSEEQAKGFIDWLAVCEERYLNTVQEKSSLTEQIHRANDRFSDIGGKVGNIVASTCKENSFNR